MSRAGRVYIWCVFALGVAAISHSLFEILHNEQIGFDWLFLAALTLVSGSATVRLPSVPATISVSETFVFTSIILFGVAAGTLTVALDSLVISFWLLRRRPEPFRLLFNLAAPAFSVWVAATIFFASADVLPLSIEPAEIPDLIPALLLATIVYFMLNSWLTTIAISFERQTAPFPIWRQNFLWLSLNYFGGASLASLLVAYTRDIDLTHLGIIVPLLLVMYLTFKTSMARVEDAKQHLDQMNALYLSTIETLAMAIDAKDQVTHGHIRRVQQYASGLARELGVTSENEIKAIEAAALLHDMGKLAIPEHILNKPGKLTPAEFEKMKQHASIGAEILSAIDFPYPVVPIVRHHHENWDGTGYPDGLSGQAIPLGARVLSVVDCFDALTSDRPYRPRLPDDEAVRILRARSGSMYDPTAVETFIRIYRSLAPIEEDAKGNHAIGAIINRNLTISPTPRVRPADRANAEETRIVNDLLYLLGNSSTFNDAAERIALHLPRVLPASFSVFYMYEPDDDELVARFVSGPDSAALKGIRIAVGSRLSGWVASSRQTISNSDPALDLGERLSLIDPRPTSCLSTPLVVNGNIAGVLTVYSSSKNAFSPEHCRAIETVAKATAQILWDVSRVGGGAPDMAAKVVN